MGEKSTDNFANRLRFRLACFSGDARNFLRYGVNAPKVAQRLYVHPAAIENTTRRWLFNRTECGKVLQGDWDQDLIPIDELEKIALASQRVRENVSWEKVGMYRLMMRLIRKNRNGVYDGCRTLDDVVRRYERLDELIDHLKSGGVLLDGEQLGRIREEGGVLVHLGREGQFIFGRTGCHRLAIARTLNLRAMPVLLGVVHADAVSNGKFEAVVERSRQLRAGLIGFWLFQSITDFVVELPFLLPLFRSAPLMLVA